MPRAFAEIAFTPAVRAAQQRQGSAAAYDRFLAPETDRKFHWPLGRRPDDHPGLSELEL